MILQKFQKIFIYFFSDYNLKNVRTSILKFYCIFKINLNLIYILINYACSSYRRQSFSNNLLTCRGKRRKI